MQEHVAKPTGVTIISRFKRYYIHQCKSHISETLDRETRLLWEKMKSD